MDSTSLHKYEYGVDPEGDSAPARVVRMVAAGTEVLEVGSGPGSITRLLQGRNGCRVTALELDESAIEKVRPFCSDVYKADLNTHEWLDVLQGKRFEVVVAADVLEHLYDPLASLRSIASCIADNGYGVFSLPHAGHAALLACLFNNDFEYRDWGLLDRTHIRFFGIHNMQHLFEEAGLKIIAAEYVVRHPEVTEFAHQWAKLAPDARSLLLTNPFGCVYQVVLKAVHAGRSESPLSLASLPPPLAAGLSAPVVQHLRQRVAGRLSPEMRMRIRIWLSRLGIRL